MEQQAAKNRGNRVKQCPNGHTVLKHVKYCQHCGVKCDGSPAAASILKATAAPAVPAEGGDNGWW